MGIGDIFLETSIGNKMVHKDVRHVLDICLNLISIGRLDDSDKRKVTKHPLCHGS